MDTFRHKTKIVFQGPDNAPVEFIIDSGDWTITPADDAFNIVAGDVRLDFPYRFIELFPLRGD